MKGIKRYTTKSGQEVHKQKLPYGVTISYEQNVTSGGYSNNFQVRFYHSEYNNGKAVSLGTIPQEGIIWIQKSLKILYISSKDDFRTFIELSKHLIKDDVDEYTITGLSYETYELVNDFIIRELME